MVLTTIKVTDRRRTAISTMPVRSLARPPASLVKFQHITHQRLAGPAVSINRSTLATKARRLFALAENYERANEPQAALTIYRHIVRERQLRNTFHAKRAYKLMGDLYGLKDVPNAYRAYSTALSTTQSPLNLPLHYEMAMLYDDPGVAVPPAKALKHYLSMLRIFSTLPSSAALKLPGTIYGEQYDASRPDYIAESFIRLLAFYTARRNTNKCVYVIQQLASLAKMGTINLASSYESKRIFAAAIFLYHRLNTSLSMRRTSNAIIALKGLAAIASAMDGNTSKRIQRVFAKCIDLVDIAAKKYLQTRRYHDVHLLLGAASMIIANLDSVSERMMKNYISLMKVYNSKHLYDKVHAIYGMAERALDKTSVMRRCPPNSPPFVRCGDEEVNVFADIRRIALTSCIGRYLTLAIKGRRSRPHAVQALTYSRRMMGILASAHPTDDDYAHSLYGIAGAYEFSGARASAIRIYRKIIASTNINSSDKYRAKFRLAVMEGRIADAKASLRNMGSHVDESHDRLIAMLPRIRASLGSGHGGPHTTHVTNGIAIQRFGNSHLLYDIGENKLLAVVRGRWIRVNSRGIVFPPDVSTGRSFAVSFTSFNTQTIANYNALIATIKNVPRALYSRLRTIYFDNKVVCNEVGYYTNRTITIHSDGGSVSTVQHEMGHLWDDMNSRIMRLFRNISWKGTRRREADQRDFQGSCSIPVRRYNPVSFRGLVIPANKRICARGQHPYGMMNRLEDFATYIENYGSALRTSVMKQLRGKATSKQRNSLANPEPAIKYLFVKYMTPFAGKEYGVTASSPGIDISEIEDRLTNSTLPKAKRLLKIMHRIMYGKTYYRVDGVDLRTHARGMMEEGNFTFVLRYLYLKYRVFRGNEFLEATDPEDKPITARGIKKAALQWLRDDDVDASKKRRVRRLLSRINWYARRYL